MNNTFQVGFRSSPVTGVLLQDALPGLVDALTSRLATIDRENVSHQLPEVLIPSQALAGTSDDFSFLAYPISTTYPEVRENLVFTESEVLFINLFDGRVVVELNEFGIANWFFLQNLPNFYFELLKLHGIINASENPRPIREWG